MRTLNLGILAHVDAGKTTLSERLLFAAGAIDHVGSVDAGTTQTDSLDLERERGITIRSAVASFFVGDLAVNLVDTPGHPDFIAEVERVLGVLDGAVLVVSAVEGVQPQTPLLFRALQRLHVPTLIFVNKLDRAGADPDRVVEAMRRRLAPGILPMGTAREPGAPRRGVRAVRRGRRDPPSGGGGGARRTRRRHPRCLRRRRDDAHARAPARATRGPDPGRRHRPGLLRFRGTGHRGLDTLLAGIDELLDGSSGDPEASVSGRVFKIEHGRHLASASRTCACSRGRCGRVSACGSGEGRRPSRRRSASSPRPERRAGTCWPPARWPPSEAWARSGWVMRSGSRHQDTTRPRASRGPRWKPWSSRFGRTNRAHSTRLSPSSPSRTHSSTSGGTTHRHEIAVVAVRRGPEGGHPGDAGARVRHRRRLPRDHDGVHRASRHAIGEAEEIIRAKTKTNITGRSSPDSTNPFMATLALRIEPAAAGSGVEVRTDIEPRLVPLYLFKTAGDVRRAADDVHPRGAGRGSWPAGR